MGRSHERLQSLLTTKDAWWSERQKSTTSRKLSRFLGDNHRRLCRSKALAVMRTFAFQGLELQILCRVDFPPDGRAERSRFRARPVCLIVKTKIPSQKPAGPVARESRSGIASKSCLNSVEGTPIQSEMKWRPGDFGRWRVMAGYYSGKAFCIFECACARVEEMKDRVYYLCTMEKHYHGKRENERTDLESTMRPRYRVHIHRSFSSSLT